MRQSQHSQSKTTIELTARGVFQISSAPVGGPERKKIARMIRLRAIGQREGDGVTFAQIRFRTMHKEYRSEVFPRSKFLLRNRHEIKSRLADLGYEWPENESLSGAILDELAKVRPEREFRMVSATGWYNSAFVLPDKVFTRGNKTLEIYIDPNTDAHAGAFVLGEGSLKDWQELVAKPSRQSSRLRLSIAAALAAPFLRLLGLELFWHQLVQ